MGEPMRFTTILGVILIIAGTAGLIWGGFDIPQRSDVAEIGPVEVEAETTERIPIPWWLAGAGLVGGIVLVGAGSRRG